MFSLKILLCAFCAFLLVEQTMASCAMFQRGGDGLGSTLMSYLLIQGLRNGGGFQGAQGAGKDGHADLAIHGATNTQVVTPIVARSPSLLLPLLLASSFGGLGGRGGLGGLGLLGLPLLMGMGGGGLGGMSALAPLALLGMGGMGGGGLGAIAPLALLGMGRFRPFGRRVIYTNQGLYKDVRLNPAVVEGKEKMNRTAMWSPIASANHLRKHFGYGFLWGRKRAEYLKKVADDIQDHPRTLGDFAGRVWGHDFVDHSMEANSTDIHNNPSRGTMSANKFVRWVNKVSKSKSRSLVKLGEGLVET